MPFTTYGRNKILDWLFGRAELPTASAWRVSLSRSTPTIGGSFDEVEGPRATMPNNSVAWRSALAGRKELAEPIAYRVRPGEEGWTFTHLGLFDDTGSLFAFYPLGTPFQPTVRGQTVLLTITMDDTVIASGALAANVEAVFRFVAGLTGGVEPAPNVSLAANVQASFGAAAALTVTPAPATGTAWYVAPNGSASNTGAIGSPWSFAHARAGANGQILPGHVVYLRAGTYGSGGDVTYAITVSGSSSARVRFTNYPGEQVTIDGNLRLSGNYVEVWGDLRNGGYLRVTNSSTDRSSLEARPPGLSFYANGGRAVNVIVDNAGHPGIQAQSISTRDIIEGCILFGSGSWDVQDSRYSGSAIYCQNKQNVGRKVIRGNVSFFGYSTVGKIYSTCSSDTNGCQNNVDVEENVFFEQGIDRLHNVGGTNWPNRGIRVNRNCFYTSVTADMNVEWGSNYLTDSDPAGGDNSDGEFIGNVLWGSNHGVPRWGSPFRMFRYKDVVFTDNLVVGYGNLAWYPPAVKGAHVVDRNAYYFPDSSTPFEIYNPSQNRTADYTFAQWRANLGYDPAGTFTQSLPTGATARLIQTPDPAIAYLAIFNWQGAGQVSLDLNDLIPGFLAVGQQVRYWDVQDFFSADRIQVGYGFAGAEFIFQCFGSAAPMVPIVGVKPRNFTHTPPQFQCFVIEKL